METLYIVNLVIHASAGALGLMAMCVPLLSKKGGRLHRRAGWVFTAAMATIAVTGVAMALSWVLVPLHVKPPHRALSPDELARYLSQLRVMAVFFGLLAVLVGSAAWQGIVATRQRTGVIAWGNPVDRGFAITTGALGALALLVGLAEPEPLLMGFGVLGLVGAFSDLRFYRRMKHERGTWLLRHVQAMLGGATAATTAFTVQIVDGVLRNAGYGEWSYAAWAVPVMLGTSASVLWSRRLRRSMAPGYTRS